MATLRKGELDFKLCIAPNARVGDSSASARIEIGQPRRFGLWSVTIIYAYGVLLAIPVLLSVMGMTLIPSSVWSLALPFIGLAFSALILPIGQGNLHVTRLVRSWTHPSAPEPGQYIVQLTFSPRLRGGLRAMLETADDVGLLTIGPDVLTFQGDAVQFTATYQDVNWIRPENIGWRGLFVYGQPVAFRLSMPEGEFSCQVAERSSWLLPASHRVMRAMRSDMKGRLNKVDGPRT